MKNENEAAGAAAETPAVEIPTGPHIAIPPKAQPQTPEIRVKQLEEELGRVQKSYFQVQNELAQLRVYNGQLANQARELVQKIDKLLSRCENLHSEWFEDGAAAVTSQAPWLQK